MATPPESSGRVRNLRAILDEKYEKKAKQLQKQQGKHLDPEQKIFMKTVSDFRLLVAQSMPEAEMIKEGQSIISLLKKDGKFDSLPSEFKQDLLPFVGDEEQEKGKGSSPVSSSQKTSEEENQGVNIGPAAKSSSQSPTQANFKREITVGQNVNKDAEEMQQKMENLEKALVEERGKVQNQDKILRDRENELKEIEKVKQAEIEKLAERLEEKDMQWANIKRDLDSKQKMNVKLEAQLNEYISREQDYKKAWEEMNSGYKKQLEKERHEAEKARQRDKDHFQEMMEDERRKSDGQYKKLLMERDDLRDRFSKLAGAKLQEKNADIADLSDPNRAMKLSERFGQIYDDEWTNAFENLTDKKLALPLKDAIALLLRFLQDCWSFCNKLMTTQMDSLHNVFLHPSQNSANLNPKQNVGGMNDRPRIGSKDDKALFALRRQIGVSPTVTEEVKQALLSEAKTWNKDKMGYEKKHVEACTPYLQKCAEICWLMALHDPPLHMKMDVKPGEKLNPNIYSVYSSSGNTIDFLVWPPLLNGVDGGLLAKGVAEPQRIVGKKK